MHYRGRDRLYLALLLLSLVAVPLGLKAYDTYFWDNRIPDGAKVFTLTGHSVYGWILGDLPR